MKIGFNPGSIVDTNGAPLQGRVTVYVHDSLEKKSIYTLQGSDYVASENPVLLDTAGRIPTTLFFDVGVVDVLVQRYIGEPGQMSDASPDTDFEDFDRFEAGFDFDPDKESSQTVDTIADLKDIENPSGVVLVNCYTTPGDTFPRFYLWNPNCSTSEDGGCVIADTHDASGMWCYLCEGDCIKSSVYGIKPGTDEANIGNFASAPLSIVGTYTVKYPDTIYFERGIYSLTTTNVYCNNHKVVFSCNAKFTSATIYAKQFDVDGSNSNYIADMICDSYNGDTKVYLSWFRTATAFWNCHAQTMVLDKTTYLESSTISGSPGVYGAIIVAQNATSFNFTFSTNSYVMFSGVTFVGKKFLDGNTFVGMFHNCNFSDDIFNNPSNIDFGAIGLGHRIEVDNWKITDALDADVWLAWANAAGMSIVDLCGRSVKNLYYSNIQEFRNGVFLGGTVSTNVNVKFTDIGGSLTVYPMGAGKSLTLDHCNNVNLLSDTPFSSIVARDSGVVVAGNGIDSSVTSYSHDGGMVQAKFKCAGWDDNSGTHAKGNEVNLRNVVLNIGNFSWFDCVRMHNCTINNPIHVIPYYENSDLWLDAIFVGNTFGDNGYIAFTDSSVGNVDIYGVKSRALTIKDNMFYTSGDGVEMLYFSNNASNKYLDADVTAIYEGNNGSCPMEKLDSYQLMSTYTEGSGTYKYQQTVRKYWNLSTNAYEQNGVGLKMNEVGGTWTITPIDTFYLHSAEITPNNNQFDVQLAVYATEYASTPNASIRIFDDK